MLQDMAHIMLMDDCVYIYVAKLITVQVTCLWHSSGISQPLCIQLIKPTV